jgi:hypothetical protein
MYRLIAGACLALMITVLSCKKEVTHNPDPEWRYFEVGTNTTPGDWRDSSYIVATKDPVLLSKIEAQLALPINDRQLVAGALAPGNGGYNKNAHHNFKWHIKEDDWQLVDVTVEIFDGRPYSDVDLHYSYWMNSVERFAPWSSYIKREIIK